MTKISLVSIITLSLLCSIVPNVLAFAVSSQYYDTNPLYMQPGETVETFFTLQNLAGDRNVTIMARITYGEKIITLLDESDIYNVPLGEKKKVNFKITIPSDTKTFIKVYPLCIAKV